MKVLRKVNESLIVVALVFTFLANGAVSAQTNSQSAEEQPTPYYQQVVEDPSVLLENDFINSYGLYIVLGLSGTIILALAINSLRKKAHQAKEIKRHTNQPYSRFSIPKKRRNKSADPQAVEPESNNHKADPNIDTPTVKQEVIKTKEVKVKESDPSNDAQPVAQPQPQPQPQPQQPNNKVPATPSVESPPATNSQSQQPASSPPPVSNNHAQPANQPSQNAQAQARPQTQQQQPASKQTGIVVGDALEDD